MHLSTKSLTLSTFLFTVR